MTDLPCDAGTLAAFPVHFFPATLVDFTKRAVPNATVVRAAESRVRGRCPVPAA